MRWNTDLPPTLPALEFCGDRAEEKRYKAGRNWEERDWTEDECQGWMRGSEKTPLNMLPG